MRVPGVAYGEKYSLLFAGRLEVEWLYSSVRPCAVSTFRGANVTKNSPDQLWFQRYFEFHCDDCGGDTGFRSRRRTFSERYLLPIFLLQPVRCAECFRRDYRFIFMPVRERLSEVVVKLPNCLPPVSAKESGNTRNVA